MSSININNKFPSVIDNFLDSKIQKVNPKSKNNKLINSTRQLINLPLPNINLTNLYEKTIDKSKEKKKKISLDQIYKINRLNNNIILPSKNKLVANNISCNNFANFAKSNDTFKSINNSKQIKFFYINNDNTRNSNFQVKALKNSQSINLNSIRINKRESINDNFFEINNNNNNKIKRISNKLFINKYNSYDSLKNKTLNIIKNEPIQNYDEYIEKNTNEIQNENNQEKNKNENTVQTKNKENNNMFITRINFTKNLSKFNKTCEKNNLKKEDKKYLYNTANFNDLLKQLRENKKIISQNQNELEIMIKTAKDAQKELWNICDKNK